MAPTTWERALGIHDSTVIRHALAKVVVKHPDWPPTLPQFLSCCLPQPEDYGAPSVESAWNEARNNAMQASSHGWSHDAVVFVGRKIGWGEIHRATGGYAVELQRRFKAEYAKAVEVLAQGVPLLQSDSDKPASLHAELASVARADEAASKYQGMNAEQSLRLMRAMTGTKRDGG